MGKKVVVEHIDDIDGKVIRDGDLNVVRFSLDGKQEREMDLSGSNAARFRKDIQRYVDASRTIGTPVRRPKQSATQAASSAGSTALVRKWARENGLKVNARGRIRGEVMDAYKKR